MSMLDANAGGNLPPMRAHLYPSSAISISSGSTPAGSCCQPEARGSDSAPGDGGDCALRMLGDAAGGVPGAIGELLYAALGPAATRRVRACILASNSLQGVRDMLVRSLAGA
jgi:hypothetical protein